MKRGIVKCSYAMLESLLFNNEATIERVVETDDDLARGQVSLVVREHHTLPDVVEGQTIPMVRAVFEKIAFHFEPLSQSEGGE